MHVGGIWEKRKSVSGAVRPAQQRLKPPQRGGFFFEECLTLIYNLDDGVSARVNEHGVSVDDRVPVFSGT